MSDTKKQLRRAYNLLKMGKKREAAKVLTPVLNADPSNADAWWLMANSLNSPDKVRQSLQNVLKYRPDHAKARAMLDQLNGNAFSEPADDVFDIAAKSTPTKTQKTSGSIDPVTVGIIAVGGVLVVAVAALVLILVSRGGSGGGMVCPDNVSVPVDAIEATETVFFGLHFKGCIAPGQSINDTVDTFDDDGWAFYGEAGQEFVIEAVSRSALDPTLYFFDPRGRLIAEHDDIDFANDNTNARLYVKLPDSGTYTIVVSAFGEGGAYELTMQ